MNEAAKVGGAQSIRRAVQVLRILAAGQERGVRLTDLVAESGLNRATAHRILRVLAEEGAVEQDLDSRRYMVGPEVSLLGLARTARFPIKAIADPHLQAIGEQAGDTTYLTIRSGFDSICVDRKVGAYPVKVLAIEIGARRPLGVGVGGLALLAFLPEAEGASIIEANRQRLAQHQLSTARLTERVRSTRSRGYAYTDAGVVRGTKAVAVPVFDAGGTPIAAITVAAIADRLGAQRLAPVIELMNAQAALITRRLAALAGARR